MNGISFTDKIAKIFEKLKQVLEKKNQLEREILEVRKEIELKQNSRSYYNLGIALTREKKWNEAVIAYCQGIEIEPDFHWWFYHNIWEAFAREDKLMEILNFFQMFQKANPDSFWSYLNIGEALTCLGKIDEAIPYYQTACYQQTTKKYPSLVSQPWNLEQVQGPNFIIIGVQKGGTTSLFGYLTQHPQIMSPIKKEIDFWSWKFNESINWYLAHFPVIPDGKKILAGEASPSYFNHPDAARRIYQFFPKIKLIILLRNPVVRAISQYYTWRRFNWENRSLEEAIESDLDKLINNPEKVNYWMGEQNYLAKGVYIEFLKEWMSLLKQIMTEDLAIDEWFFHKIFVKSYVFFIRENKRIDENEFIKILSKNLSEREHELMEMAYNTVRKRTADSLIKLYETYRGDNDSSVNFDISRADLAGMVGTATESVIRILSEFKKDDWISIDGSSITILEPEKIANVKY